jgi:hypothetical protein
LAEWLKVTTVFRKEELLKSYLLEVLEKRKNSSRIILSVGSKFLTAKRIIKSVWSLKRLN